ncbi:hypothetical protein NPIL_73041 [Nephila pilipes]|uniref:Uncharacterized protein n=1 Tax=Nephila pilipes TaxID=299642 RepID=A0A8X6PKE1_NEPPI|nr:hypothetical protein NPIL_73041 [Nephila pilipes]
MIQLGVKRSCLRKGRLSLGASCTRADDFAPPLPSHRSPSFPINHVTTNLPLLFPFFWGKRREQRNRWDAWKFLSGGKVEEREDGVGKNVISSNCGVGV